MVFLAHDHDLGRDVALKVLSDQTQVSRERFQREAALLSTLRHDRIVHYITHGITLAGECYIVERWIDGRTLRSHLARTGFTAQQSVTLAGYVAEALAAAHARGIVHRDVKPENLLLEHGEIARLTVVDFGIARQLHSVEHLTRTGAMLGTPGYMAPEQALGSRAIDARADVFALGCVLYECLTGRHAFAGFNPLAIRAKVLNLRPPPLSRYCPEAPVALVDLVAKMMAKEPADRPRDASEVQLLLTQVPPIPGERMRRVVEAEIETETVNPDAASDSLACVVMAVSLDDAHETLSNSAAQAARSALYTLDGTVSELSSGTLVFTCNSGEPAAAQIRSAIDAAFRMHAAIPRAAVSISSNGLGDLDAALDQGAATLHQLCMKAIFSDFVEDVPHANCVSINAESVAHVPDEFRVTGDEKHGFWLCR